MPDQQNCNPLVSIIVITYNSSKYVLETLESAKAQTYQNIELIISDDRSCDNTIDICQRWVKKNKDRFVRTLLVENGENTGIVKNCNRGVKAATGEWVKLIAGDDVLHPEAIEAFTKYVNNSLHRDNIYIVFGNYQHIVENKIEPEIHSTDISFKNLSAYEQYKVLILGNMITTGSTSFLKIDTFYKLGYYDEDIPYIEDYPFWIKATKNNFKLYFIEQVVAYYRKHEEGVYSRTLIGKKSDNIMKESLNQLRRKYLIPNLIKEMMLKEAYHTWLINKKETTNYKFCKIIFKILLLTDPIFYFGITRK